MEPQTVAAHREEILTCLQNGVPAFGMVTPVTGQLWWTAAKTLETEGVVLLLGAHPTQSNWYVCIPPDATWDYAGQRFTRQ